MSTLNPVTPRPGDVVELETRDGLAYVQYCLEYPMMASLVRVLDGIFSQRPTDLGALVEASDRFVAFFPFFPLRAAVRRGLMAVVAHHDVPESLRTLPLFKSGGYRDPEGRVASWFLWDGGESVHVGKALTDEQQSLPDREIVNDTLLIERILEGWKPSDSYRPMP
ncbi:MAG: hypothetical protein H0T39_07035 [Actinobacteria bacterium]|nr:hypothetical protein [Actinomycetota bacterium]